MILGHHEIGYTALVVAYGLALMVPFLLATRGLLRIAALATAAWAAFGFVVFYTSPGLGFGDALGVSVLFFFLPWALSFAAGVAVRHGRERASRS